MGRWFDGIKNALPRSKTKRLRLRKLELENRSLHAEILELKMSKQKLADVIRNGVVHVEWVKKEYDVLEGEEILTDAEGILTDLVESLEKENERLRNELKKHEQ